MTWLCFVEFFIRSWIRDSLWLNYWLGNSSSATFDFTRFLVSRHLKPSPPWAWQHKSALAGTFCFPVLADCTYGQFKTRPIITSLFWKCCKSLYQWANVEAPLRLFPGAHRLWFGFDVGSNGSRRLKHVAGISRVRVTRERKRRGFCSDLRANGPEWSNQSQQRSNKARNP